MGLESTPGKSCKPQVYSPKAGIPGKMTGGEWSDYFKALKATVQPSAQREPNIIDSPEEITDRYTGHTQEVASSDKYRNRYLSTVLMNLRMGETEYVYHIYNIFELLKYEYDRLEAAYIYEEDRKRGCFTVWLRGEGD